MTTLEREVKAFAQKREEDLSKARQNAAFFLVSGIDLREALAQKGEERRKTILRLGRLLERERLKGARKHWSYDLNRHIALKQAYDRLIGITGR